MVYLKAIIRFSDKGLSTTVFAASSGLFKSLKVETLQDVLTI